MLFSILVVPIYIPTNSVQEFPLLNILSAFFVCRLCDDSHSDLCDLTSISLIICILASFHVLFSHTHVLYGAMCIYTFCLFYFLFNLGFDIDMQELFVCF